MLGAVNACRVIACVALSLATISISGCGEDNEKKLRAVLNIDGNYKFGSGGYVFQIEDFDVKYAKAELVVHSKKGGAPLVSIRETAPCIFTFTFDKDGAPNAPTRVIDFNKLNLNAFEYFDVRMPGNGAIRVPGASGAIRNTFGWSASDGNSETELLISGFRAIDKTIYIDRLNRFRAEHCKGRD